MDFIFSVISVETFWNILLFCHFMLAVALLAGLSLQSVAVLVPERQAVGGFLARLRPVPGTSFVSTIVILYVLDFLFGAWVYTRYRTYVRLPMEQFRAWWTVGSFEFKEHVMTMGLGLLPAYWYFWKDSPLEQHIVLRRWLTVFLAFTVWYAFIVGHVANDFRGVGS
jgi:hypothetical protein